MTNNPSTTVSLQLGEAPDARGCGCGGCGCGATTDSHTKEAATMASPSTQTFEVTGMTCGHCSSAVTTELQALYGVNDVHVDLVASGTSRVTIRVNEPLSVDQVSAALEEAGGYRLA